MGSEEESILVMAAASATRILLGVRGTWIARRALSRTSALFALVSILTNSACALILPAIPQNAPGYGREYRIKTGTGSPAFSGLLILRTEFSYGPRKINVIPIVDGRARVPDNDEVRFSYSVSPGFPLYLGAFTTATSTYLFPMIRGHAAVEPYSPTNEGRLSAPGWSKAGDGNLILVVPASEHEELEMLRHVVPEMSETPQEQRMSDYFARKKILDYIRRRVAELGQPVDDWFASESDPAY